MALDRAGFFLIFLTARLGECREFFGIDEALCNLFLAAGDGRNDGLVEETFKQVDEYEEIDDLRGSCKPVDLHDQLPA